MNWPIFLGFFLLSYLSCSVVESSVKGYISTTVQKKFGTFLLKTLSDENVDIGGIYYGITGIKLLKEQLDKGTVLKKCEFLMKNFKGDEDVEIIFYALSSWSKLGCSGKIHKDTTVQNLHNVVVNEKSTPANLRFAVDSLKVLGETLKNPARISQIFQAKLKEDDSLHTFGQAFHVAIHLGPTQHGKFAVDRIEDVVVQLDEINGQLLQWEGGLSITSSILTGILGLNTPKPFTQSQADKIANYLLTRTTVQTVKGVVALLEAVDALTKSQISPVSIGIIGKSIVTKESPELKIRVSDLLGSPLKTPPSPVLAVSATRVIDDVVVLSKQPLAPGSNPTEFILKLKLDPDHYQVALSAGEHTTNFNVRVLGELTIKSFEIGLSDVDGTTSPQLIKLNYPNGKLSNVLKADSSNLLVSKFMLSRPIHQAFLKLSSGTKEIIFIAEQDNNKVHKVEINLMSEFSHSGLFDIELILGDSVISKSIKWNLGKIEINLGREEGVTKNYKEPKPEIKHLFREAEKRPPSSVSLFFSILTAAPLLLLIVLWLNIGLNFNNFSVISIPFHLGFGSILCLFLCFWLKLNMFTTCAWLIPLGAFTFLSGHKVLNKLANSKKVEKKD